MANLNTPAKLNSRYNKESHEAEAARSLTMNFTAVGEMEQVPSKSNSGLSGREAFGVSNYLNRGGGDGWDSHIPQEGHLGLLPPSPILPP